MREEPPTSKTLGYYFIILGGHVTSNFGFVVVNFLILVFELEPVGALTPSLAFGKDFILDIPETKRYDKI